MARRAAVVLRGTVPYRTVLCWSSVAAIVAAFVVVVVVILLPLLHYAAPGLAIAHNG